MHRKNCMKTVMNFWVPYNQATSGFHITRKLLGSIQPGKLFLNCLSDYQFLSNSLYHKCWLVMQKLCMPALPEFPRGTVSQYKSKETAVSNFSHILERNFQRLNFRGRAMNKCITNCTGRVPCDAQSTHRFCTPII